MKVKAIIEMTKGSPYKYEVDKTTGRLRLDRPLNQTVPDNYGFIPGSLSADTDAADIFVLSFDAIAPLAEVDAEIHSILYCDDNGVSDDKIIAVLVGETFPDEETWYGRTISQRLEDIKIYLNTYKPGFYVMGQGSKEDAVVAYEKSVEAHKEQVSKNLEEMNKQLLEWSNKTFVKHT